MRTWILIVLTCCTALGLAACGDSSTTAAEDADTLAGVDPVIDPGDGGYAPEIDPADFTDVVDNPYFPLPPGGRWEYVAETPEGVERNVVEVTPERLVVMGVSTVVVHDVVSDKSGHVVEDTVDYFAQDRDGNVWYFGEAVRNFDEGQFQDTDGSFEAGVDGALPGIVMPARPDVGDAYRQEFYPGEAEDLGEILRLGDTIDVPAGRFEDVLVTRDWNPLEPEVIEEKYYAPGVGMVYETKVAGESGSNELVSFTVS